jgi:hypothetical protein
MTGDTASNPPSRPFRGHVGSLRDSLSKRGKSGLALGWKVPFSFPPTFHLRKVQPNSREKTIFSVQLIVLRSMVIALFRYMASAFPLFSSASIMFHRHDYSVPRPAACHWGCLNLAY